MKRQSLLIVGPAMVLLSVVVIHAHAEKQTPAPTLERAEPPVSAEQAGAATLIDQAEAVARKSKPAKNKQHSSATALSEFRAGSSASLSGTQHPRGEQLSSLSGARDENTLSSLGTDATRTVQAGACTIFTNQAEFEAFNKAAEKSQKGVEDFEEAPPGQGIASLDDPLCGGIPSTPPVFPNGIDQLNLCVQSNTLAGEADVPSPHKAGGLSSVEFGIFDVSSDIVAASTFGDSFDVIFGDPVPPDQQDNHTAVGFNPVSILVGDTVAIRVFDKNNVEMVSATSPVDPAGSNFWGVWCPDTIGRINIHNTGGGPEGGDNIQMWVACGDGGDPCPFCGDGVVNQPSEECDGPDDAACPGPCQADCTCPENDDCEDSIEIFDGVQTIDTTDATTDGLPTNGLGDCSELCDPQVHNDIWFNYTATCNGELTVSTCEMVDYDSKIAIYDDCDVGLCPRGGDEIGCNDDGPGCLNAATIATADVLLGSCYKIRIGGFTATEVGTGTVEISCEDIGFCGDAVCDPGENECSCPADCPGKCPFSCTVFNNQADFEAFNAEEGKVQKGVEDFEETAPDTVMIGFPDPLCGGIPNPPFDNGIDQLNLCVQANTLGGAPVVPSPFGPPNGLVFVPLGSGFGNSSDVVLGNFLAHSFDLMFGLPVPPDQQANNTGVGFDTVTLFSASTVEIRVYDKNNIEIFSTTSPADTGGTNFWGVWCPDTIGRINIFDTIGGASGFEGADNIQMWVELSCEPECPEATVCVEGVCCGDGVVEGHEECELGGDCGSCPWDVDGSGGVGPFDLAFLLGNWGPIPPNAPSAVVCLDADGDGNIGAFDLASLLGNWGPCPPPLGGGDDQCPAADCTERCECIGRGACCGVEGDPGACGQDRTADECAKTGGIYAGDDSTCENCHPACFDAKGSCFDAHGGPGCSNPICCYPVCDFDPVCCESWDDICVDHAEELCDPPTCGDGSCDPGESVCSCAQDCPGVCPFSCTVFTNQADFEAFNEEGGKIQKGVEDFEEHAPGDTIVVINDPLCGGIPSIPSDPSAFPNGIDQLNLCVQANLLGGAPNVPFPRGPAGLVLIEECGLGNLTAIVIANNFVDSFDLMFGLPVPPDQQDNHSAVGFNPVSVASWGLPSGTTVEIRVYDKNNEEMLSTTTSPVNGLGTYFWGISCDATIGRINVYDTASGPGIGAEGTDNIQMWISEDCGEPEFCGNGICCATQGEDCDTCPGDCGACPICGDDVVNQPGEQCDGGDDAACPGQCQPNCTCPANDDCEDRIGIFDGPVPFDTTGANTDGLPHAGCQFDGQTYHDKWFAYIATCTGGGNNTGLTVQMCTAPGDAFYDTDLVVYNGCHPDDFTCPPGDAFMLGCNDDICTTPSGQMHVSMLEDLPVTTGNCYTIRIGGWNPGDEGGGILDVSCTGG